MNFQFLLTPKSVATVLLSACLGWLIDLNYDAYAELTNFQPFMKRFIMVTTLLYIIRLLNSLMYNDVSPLKHLVLSSEFRNEKPSLLAAITSALFVAYAGVNIGCVTLIAVLYSLNEILRSSDNHDLLRE